VKKEVTESELKTDDKTDDKTPDSDKKKRVKIQNLKQKQ